MSPKGSILVTGTNGGLGSAIVDKLVKNVQFSDSYYGLYTVRKLETADALRVFLEKAPASHKHEVIALDLGRLASVREFAQDINARVASGELPRIRAIIHNAAFQEYTTQTFTPDAFDMTFQVNVLSQWLLSLLLLQSMDQEDGRIVTVGSWTHDTADSRNNSVGCYREEKWKTLFHGAESLAKGTFSPPEGTEFRAGFRRYGASKLCATMIIHELQARLNGDPKLSNISVIGVDPGSMVTGISRRGPWYLRLVIRGLLPVLAPFMTLLQPNGTVRLTSKTAGDVLRAAFDTETLGRHPKDVYLNGTAPAQTGAEARDPDKRARLWHANVEYAQLKQGDTALVNWQ